MQPTIVRLSATELTASAKALATLLVDVVHTGDSVGFLSSLDADAATTWWEGLAPAVDAGDILIWVARDGDEILGTVQLKPVGMPNSAHRAEIAKLMVHSGARGRGLGRRLLAAAERCASEAGRTLLILDTETGSPAEGFYRTGGWTEVGKVPAYAADPAGELRSTTFFYKQLT
ncbi:GNAT family N-acetyltransferase [Sphaerisporangium album]|uniref:GNAT family N-acetyltransferase n=1 Tax=Sphaerisporangium album TaxID=509200 RepID=A0A367FC49_9ACTN|nr:GNAT family N-acetyltransferase [Sphaerisporangium album]RCG27831.1 GNAT family N-acetyltransferase [Sphaerisporangium album]